VRRRFGNSPPGTEKTKEMKKDVKIEGTNLRIY
jgi:hypothetical protein